MDRDMECRPTMITSVAPDAGVSYVCAYLATELANATGRVLLADAHTLLQLARVPATVAVALAEPVDPGKLWVLGPKQLEVPFVENPSARSSVAALLACCRQTFTHVIIDAPSLDVSEDAITLATAVYGTILAVQFDTRKQAVIHARERITSLGGRVLGSIFNARPSDPTKGRRP